MLFFLHHYEIPAHNRVPVHVRMPQHRNNPVAARPDVHVPAQVEASQLERANILQVDSTTPQLIQVEANDEQNQQTLSGSHSTQTDSSSSSDDFLVSDLLNRPNLHRTEDSYSSVGSHSGCGVPLIPLQESDPFPTGNLNMTERLSRLQHLQKSKSTIV